jgi:hypothetical protein
MAYERLIGGSWPSLQDLQQLALGYTRIAAHQTRHASWPTMRCPFLQPKACQNSRMFDTTLFTRYGGYERGLVRTSVRISRQEE